jgi:hypothetical protein
VPNIDKAYTATYSQSTTPMPLAFVQVNASTPQSPQSTVATTYNQAQSPGNLNVVAVGWNESVGNVVSVSDSAGNVYQPAVATFRGTGLSQAIYYARNIIGAGPGANRVTVTFDKAVTYPDIRVMEYSGADQTNPLDVTSSFAGTSSQATSGSATTHFPRELIIGAGMTSGAFTSAGTGFTTRIITNPDADIVEDRSVTTTGTYTATANQGGTWVMQMVTFKAAGQ